MAACLALVVATGAPSSMQAALITFNFQGTIDSVDSEVGPPFAVGQTLTGSYTFESTTAPTGGSNSSFAVFNALTSLNFSVPGASYSASSTASPEIQVDNNPTAPNDRYGVVSRASDGLTGAAVNGNPLDAFLFRLDDLTNTVFTDALILPTSISLSDFTSNFFFISFRAFDETGEPIFDGVDEFGDPIPVFRTVSGTFDSLSSVPEPASLVIWSVIAVSGIAFGYLRRSRQSK
jgi:hypothetical protein